MESQQQQSPGGKGFSGYSVLVLVLIAFGLGVFVGFHPLWIPLHTGASGDQGVVLPTGNRSATADDHSMAATAPSTKPMP